MNTYTSRLAVSARRPCGMLGLVLLLAARTAVAQLHVVTTTPGLADIVKLVGGEHVTVESVMRGPENIHNVQPKPSHMIKLKNADLFVHSGLDIELWASQLIKGSRNAALAPGQPGNVDVSRGIALKEVPDRGSLSRALGDIHVFGNPHYLLDPLNGAIAAGTIAGALKNADPAHAADYEKNYHAYAMRLTDLTDRLAREMQPYAGRSVVVYHRTWPYFLDRFGLVKVGEIEPKPGISPGPGHLSHCVDLMRARSVGVVIVETYNSRKNAEFVADKAHARAVVLAQEVKAIDGVDSYEAMFEYNVRALREAFDAVATASDSKSASGG